MNDIKPIEQYAASDDCLHIPATNSFYIKYVKCLPYVVMYERGIESPVKQFKFNPKTYKRKLREISDYYLLEKANRAYYDS